MRTRTALATTVLPTLLLAVTACGSEVADSSDGGDDAAGGVTSAPSTTPPAPTEPAPFPTPVDPGGYELPAAYSVDVEPACGLRAVQGTYRVQVVDGEVVDVTPVKGDPTGAGAGDVPGLEQMAAMAERARDRDAAKVEVDRTAAGRITGILIDYSLAMADEEVCYTTSNFRPTPSR